MGILCIWIYFSSTQRRHCMAKHMEGRTLPTHAEEWEARRFSATIAAPVTSGVSFEEREIKSLVVLEDIRHKISVSSDVECFTEVSGSPLSSVAASYSSSLHSNPLSGRFLTEYYNGKSTPWPRDVCKQCPPKQMQPNQYFICCFYLLIFHK